MRVTSAADKLVGVPTFPGDRGTADGDDVRGVPGCKDARMRTDPIRMAKLDLLGQYLDYQGQTMLLRTDGLSGEPLTQSSRLGTHPRRAALPPGTGGEAAARYGCTVKPASK
jgi:hypothetical protein